ncbi:MAG: ABC transporter substrate-binding protein/permease [Gemmataceae bacterium]|nr:ABC transporter substrate-binding protein/permease [Gemmataceae bacterium]MCI0741588.1 ABC transporter substrate-binding protein/permease [Gemmataceae bacterium]
MDTESQRWRWWALGLAAGLLFTIPQLFAQGPAQKQTPIKWGGDTDGGFPYVFADPKDPEKVIGFEMDLAQALEQEIGRPIVFEQRTYESLLADLERGDIDVAMNGLEIIPERLKRVAFTRPYYIYQLQLVVRADESRFKNLEEAKAKGMTIGTLGATAAERLLQDQNVSLKTYDDQQGPYEDLRQGALDGVLMDLPIAIYYAAPDKQLKYSQLKPGLKFLGPAFAEGYYGIAVRQDDKDLLDRLNRGIDNLLKNGNLKKILQKWELWTPDQYRLYETVEIVAGGEDMHFADYFPLLLKGAGVTVLITLASFALAVAIGLVIALLRMYGPAPLRWLAVCYVEFFRGIPVLLLLYFIYYGLPALVPGLKLNPFLAAVLGFGLNYAAYEAEIYRAGISSIPRGQWEAAASLGMSSPMTFRRIILPQAIRVILPPMTSDLVALFKDTSVVSIIAVVELSKQYQILTKSGGGYLQIGLTTAALYLTMSVPLGYLSRYLELRWGVKH